jgi:hypothetical protein
MVYRALGVLFSSSGFSIAFAEFHENAGVWTFELKAHDHYPAGVINPLIEEFIEKNKLQYQVALITMHAGALDITFNGASIAAATGLPVITDLADIDIHLGCNGEFYRSDSQKLGIKGEDISELNKTICVAFMGILRWREEYNFLSSMTGARRSSIGGAIWLGQEA